MDDVEKSSSSVEVVLASSNTQYKVPTTELTNKKLFILYNKSDVPIYYGGHNVSIDNGIPMNPGEIISIRASSTLYLICSVPGKKVNVLILELGRYD